MRTPDEHEPLPSEPAVDFQARLERSPTGRGLLSTLIALTLVAIVAINLPSSDLRRQIMRPGGPYLNALGLDQDWSVFAPNPRSVVLDIYAAVRLANGRMVLWRYPHDGALVGQYHDYRWRKWAEQIVSPDEALLWRPAALWAAAHVGAPAGQVRSVALLERYRTIEPPGVAPSLGPPALRVIYTLRVVSQRRGADR